MFYWLILNTFLYFTAQSWRSFVRKASYITCNHFCKRSFKWALGIHISLLHKRNYQKENSGKGNLKKITYIFSHIISSSILLVDILGQCWAG